MIKICGIMGMFSFKPIKNVDKVIFGLKQSLCRLQDRGDDATGIALVNTTSGKYKVMKAPKEAYKFVCDNSFSKFIKEFGDFNIVLGHTRSATSGDKKINVNNHPFYHKNPGSILIHNGVIRYYDDTKKKNNLKPDGECDSELLLCLYDKFLNFKKAIKRIDGSFAVGLYHDKRLYLYRDSNPLVLITDENETEDKIFYFATKEEYINNFFVDTTKFYDIFQKETRNDPYVYRELEDEQLFEVDFNNSKFKLSDGIKSGELCTGYSYNCNSNFPSTNSFDNLRTGFRIIDLTKKDLKDYELDRPANLMVKTEKLENEQANLIDDKKEKKDKRLNKHAVSGLMKHIDNILPVMNESQKGKVMSYMESVVMGDMSKEELATYAEEEEITKNQMGYPYDY